MASWTDAITQFNPYVSTLPVEAMVKVGMEKQKRYDEGVQKIQAKIDQVAGLDIIRGVDKNYLQSKLDELGSNLKTFAASDFSNYQLVNSVAGMTKQVAGDEIVQNAVSSTAFYKKQLQEMESAIKNGKSSIQNQDDFNEKANKYLSSTDLKQKFTDRYTPYIDVKKKSLDAIKLLHPQLQKYDIPFEVVNGKVNTSKIADAMKRYKIEGISEQQIEAAITSTLTPDDMNQLSIDARYQFKGVNSEQLVGLATENYKSNKETATATLDLLLQKKGIETNPTKLESIEKDIEYYESLLGKGGKPGKLDENLKSDLESISKNPDAVKTSIYKNGFIKELSNAFSWKNEDMEYVDNPIRKQMNWVADMKFKQMEFNQDVKEFNINSDFKRKELELKTQELALKNAELYGIDAPWVTMANETDMTLRAAEMYTEHSESVVNKIASGRARLITAGYTDAQINMMLNKKMDVPPKAMGVIEEIRREQNYLKALEVKEKKIRAEADKEANVSEEKRKALQNKPSLNVSWKGVNYQLSPEEILGIRSATKESKQDTRFGVRRIVTVDESGLNAQQLKFVRGMKGALYGDFLPSTPPAKGTDQINSQINSVLQKYDSDIKSLSVSLKKSDEIYKQKLSPLVSKFVPQWKVLGSDKDGSPTPITIGKLSNLVSSTIQRGIKADSDYDPSEASDMLKSENAKDTRVFIQQSGDDYQVIIKSEKDPSKVQRIKLSRAEVVANFGDKYVNDNTEESIRLGLGNGNTNLTGNPEYSYMQKQFGDFPGVRKMNITADFDQDLSNPDVFVPSVNVMKKDGKFQTFILSGQDKLSRVGFDQGKKNLNALTDDVLLKYLKLEYPNYDYSQLDIK